MHIGGESYTKIFIFRWTYALFIKKSGPRLFVHTTWRGPKIIKNRVRGLPGLGAPKTPPAASRHWPKRPLKKDLTFNF